MMPAMAERYSFGEVGRVIEEVFAGVAEEPRITISVHMDVAEAVEKQLNTLTKEKGFEGKILVKVDESMESSDCKVDWGTGGSERNTTELWANITSILDRNIGDKPTIWDNPEEIEINRAEVASVKGESDTPVPLVDNSLEVDVCSSEGGNTNNTEVTNQEQPTDEVQQTNID